MATLNSHLDRFLRERIYLKNVSPKTRVWYETAWKTFVRTQVPDFGTRTIDSPQAITRQHLQEFVVALRDRGVRPVTVNTWLCALNAFCRWLHDEGTLAEPVRLKRLKVERRLVKTLDEAALRGILSFRPKDYSQWRVQTAVATIIDTGSGESRRPGGASNRVAGFASSRWIFMMSYSGPIMDTPPTRRTARPAAAPSSLRSVRPHQRPRRNAH